VTNQPTAQGTQPNCNDPLRTKPNINRKHQFPIRNESEKEKKRKTAKAVKENASKAQQASKLHVAGKVSNLEIHLLGPIHPNEWFDFACWYPYEHLTLRRAPV
jgi:hypothetical protein